MFINDYCLFTRVILLCHVGEGPVLTALIIYIKQHIYRIIRYLNTEIIILSIIILVVFSHFFNILLYSRIALAQ